MADRNRQLDQAEEEFVRVLADVLTETADEFSAAVADATELVAARFSVGRIARMWSARTRRLVRQLLGTADTSAVAAAEDIDAELPDGWDDLPARYDDNTLPEPMRQYVEVTEHLLRAVGDRLADVARVELAQGIAAGEDVDQLRDRLRAAFARDGAQLGPAREQRIARTEATRAWNTATLEAARAATGPDRPVVKQWVTRHDNRVRTEHNRVDGQLRPLDEPFTVAGVAMQTPGDPSAPAGLVIQCRCRLAVAPELRAAASESQASLGAGFSEARENRVEPRTLTAASGHTGAMIALVPSEEDIKRLALDADGAEVAEELHLTLFYLGEGADWNNDARNELCKLVHDSIHDRLATSVYAKAFGVNHWNGDGEDPCWVWAVGDDPDRPDGADQLEVVRYAVVSALEDMHQQPELPRQHSPWQPHVCAAYTRASLLEEMNARLGPVRFDRVRVAFAGAYTDFPLEPVEETAMVTTDPLAPRPWSNPGDTALVYEDEETGDGRVFRAGSLYWSGAGPWPLQYADEMLMGHQGAELAGAIQTLSRDGARIPGSGVLYPGLGAGAEALMILEQQGPLGVSVDLDDVAVEFVDRRPPEEDEGEDEGMVVLLASLPSASMMRLADGSWSLSMSRTDEWTASGASLARTGVVAQLLTGPGGRVSAEAVQRALGTTGTLTAAAGDRADQGEGTVVHRESSGDLLMRVTRARLRGATLVAMPAYDRARIVLDDFTASATSDGDEVQADAGPSPAQKRVISFVKTSPQPVGARDVARALDMRIETARGHLGRAAKAGLIVRLSRGLYVGPTTDMSVTASASGDTDLPVHDDPERPWDGGEAQKRVLAWATDDDGTVDTVRLGAAYLWRDDDVDPATASAYKLPFADVISGELRIVAEGVYAAGSVLQGSMGGVDLPEDDVDTVKDRAAALYARLAEAYDDDTIRPPWTDDQDDQNDQDHEDDVTASELVASAWDAMQDLEPMPAAWFKEPTAEELPPGSGGVHLAKGRVYGWVAQAGVPHAGYPGKNLTIESLGKLDLSHFLRARMPLDDGTMMRVGAMTMDVGHHRDGAECETAVCQFDDTRTVGAIVTVGQNEGGLWFSGAAGPWLADWDRKVFAGCQPSYHLKQGPGGRWQLRAVLTVPVPGHSSQLLAATVAERSNLALAASAAGRADLADSSGHGPDLPADSSGQLPDNPATDPGGTGPDLPGHRPDIVQHNPADSSGHSPDSGGDLDALAAALLADDSALDVLLDAMNRRKQQREEAARDEAAHLAASVIDPARVLLAAGHTTTEGAS